MLTPCPYKTDKPYDRPRRNVFFEPSALWHLSPSRVKESRFSETLTEALSVHLVSRNHEF